MIPRDLFNRMAALALVAILISAVLSCRAFAVDTPSGDGSSEPSDDAPASSEEDPPGDALDPSEGDPPGDDSAPSEEDPPGDASDPSGEDPPGDAPDSSEEDPPGDASVAADIAAIRLSLELLVYGIIPFVGALFLVYKFCMWFYCTFIRGVL